MSTRDLGIHRVPAGWIFAGARSIERFHWRNFVANIKATFTAVYYSHETTDLITITQEFEGPSYEEIAYEYFGIWGDMLGSLTYKTDNGNLVVYDNMKAVQEWQDEMGCYI